MFGPPLLRSPSGPKSIKNKNQRAYSKSAANHKAAANHNYTIAQADLPRVSHDHVRPHKIEYDKAENKQRGSSS
jgi:bisphosphoglycerate-dependent phosphoglycerate mutase